VPARARAFVIPRVSKSWRFSEDRGFIASTSPNSATGSLVGIPKRGNTFEKAGQRVRLRQPG